MIIYCATKLKQFLWEIWKDQSELTTALCGKLKPLLGNGANNYSILQHIAAKWDLKCSCHLTIPSLDAGVHLLIKLHDCKRLRVRLVSHVTVTVYMYMAYTGVIKLYQSYISLKESSCMYHGFLIVFKETLIYPYSLVGTVQCVL